MAYTTVQCSHKMAFSAIGERLCRNFFKTSLSRLLVFTRTLSDLKGYTPRRSFLYIPGNEERKVSKATGLNSDCVVLDCEDGVASNKKVSLAYFGYFGSPS